jgi:hypothetical protein
VRLESITTFLLLILLRPSTLTTVVSWAGLLLFVDTTVPPSVVLRTIGLLSLSLIMVALFSLWRITIDFLTMVLFFLPPSFVSEDITFRAIFRRVPGSELRVVLVSGVIVLPIFLLLLVIVFLVFVFAEVAGRFLVMTVLLFVFVVVL